MASAIQATLEAATMRRDAFTARFFESVEGTMRMFTIYLGDKLGFYEVLKQDGPLTAAELAARTGTHPRYVREWLEQQTVAGVLEVLNPDADAETRRFRLPEGHDEVLADRDSLNYLAPLAQAITGGVRPIDDVLRAFRTGGGVPFGDYGPDIREGQARMNRAAFLKQLGQEWVPAMPDVDRRLRSDPPARVADFGCGAGWSSIGLARCYPKVLVDGFDLDSPSIEMACANAVEAGLTDRVRFHVRDAADPELAGRYDFVMAMECIHDMANPVGALRTIRRLLAPGGAVLVVDERVGDTFTPTGNDVEALMYGFSVLHCLPAGMSEEPSAGTGTVLRTPTLRNYAREAGFRDVEILPVENFLFRLYRLWP
jgi:2-polyprenyl-3-methyl-5-hydroxy-6-metoxy-1,4-benzoquinol methylase